jgi:hypothetical protein
LIGAGAGIHWPDLDEDLSVESLLAGRPSAESQASLKKWLTDRKALANKRMQPAGANSRAKAKRRRARGGVLYWITRPRGRRRAKNRYVAEPAEPA